MKEVSTLFFLNFKNSYSYISGEILDTPDIWAFDLKDSEKQALRKPWELLRPEGSQKLS